MEWGQVQAADHSRRLVLPRLTPCGIKVGLVGCSSTAEWQMAVASMGHPALAAIIPATEAGRREPAEALHFV